MPSISYWMLSYVVKCSLVFESVEYGAFDCYFTISGIRGILSLVIV